MTELERRSQTRRDAAMWMTSLLALALLFAAGLVLFV